MSAALRKVYADLQKRFGSLSKNDIMARYEIGRRIDNVLTDEKKYGANAANQLAAALGKSEGEIYNLKNVSVTWSREDLQELLEIRNAKNNELTFTHLRALASIRTAKTRKRFYNTWLKEGLTTRELDNAIQTELGQRSAGGRAGSAPRSPSAGLTQLHKLVNRLLESQDHLDEAVFDKIDEEPESNADAKLLHALETADGDLAALSVKLDANRRKVASALDTVHRVILSRQGVETETPSRPAKTKPAAKAKSSKPKKTGATTAARTKGNTAAAIAAAKAKAGKRKAAATAKA